MVQFMKNNDIKYHLTITFPQGISRKFAISALDALLKKINSRLDRYYMKKKRFLKGFAIHEYQKNGTSHFHIALIDDTALLPGFHTLDALISKCIQSLKKKGDYRQLIGNQCWVLQKYYNHGDDALENYLNKNFCKPTISSLEAYASVGFIGRGGVSFGDEIAFHTHV